jgi:hypothetical protein
MLTDDLARFYELLGMLESAFGQGRTLGDYAGREPWPARGVYFFREPGEYRTTRSGFARIVRVGTHAVAAGARSTLWGRLRAHRGSQDGRGNHRGSIFRLHIGTALLERDREAIGELPTWAQGSSAAREIRASEADHERRVSAHVGSMSVLWVCVPDEPGPESHRAYIERNSIALLSNRLNPLDPPSTEWLGRHSPRHEIRNSGLWNLNHVREHHDPGFLDLLEHYVATTRR